MMSETLIGSVEAGRYASRYLHGYGASQQTVLIVVTLVGLALLWIVLIYWEQLLNVFQPPPPEQESLFRGLCHHHGLSRGERLTLTKLAEHHQLKDAAVLFISSRYYQEPSQPVAFLEKSQSLRKKLFGY